MKNKQITVLFIVILIVFAVPSTILAKQLQYTFSFQCISFSSTENCNIGEQQLRLEVKNLPGSSYDALFTFINTGPNDSSITDIYFNGPTFLTVLGTRGLAGSGTSILDYSSATISPKTSDVAFSPNATPPNLPALDAKLFSANYSADSDPPVQPNGVNPGESVYFKFKYNDPSNDISDLNEAIAIGSLSIGINVQGFGSGGSELFVLSSITGIDRFVHTPEPATMLLLGTGLAGLAGVVRKRRKLM